MIANTEKLHSYLDPCYDRIEIDDLGYNAYLLDSEKDCWVLCELHTIQVDITGSRVYTGCTRDTDVDDCYDLKSHECFSISYFNDCYQDYLKDSDPAYGSYNVYEQVVKFYTDVKEFNCIAGKLEYPVQRKTLKNAVERIEEELNELRYKGVLDENPKEILDGIVDVLVTAFGFAQLLERNGYNVARAMRKIAHNNLTKFVDDSQIAQDTVKMYADKGEECYVKNDLDKFVVLRKSDDKVMKPIGYISVDINDCLPD